MAAIGPGDGPYGEEDRLPWLEAAEEERTNPSLLKIAVLVVAGIAVLGAVAGGYSWWLERQATHGNGALIAAPAGPYKVRPRDPGGLRVEGVGESVFAASEGVEPQGRIDAQAVAEVPLTRQTGATPGFSPDATPGAIKAVQLGAFSSEAAANAAWQALASRFAYLAPLSHVIVPAGNEGKTLYRLRAQGPDAGNICARLRIAGETCTIVD